MHPLAPPDDGLQLESDHLWLFVEGAGILFRERPQAEHRDAAGVEDRAERFGKDVGSILGGGDVGERDLALVDGVSDEEIAQVHVLGALVVDRVVARRDDAHVVIEDGHGRERGGWEDTFGQSTGNFGEDATEENCGAGGVQGRHGFGRQRRQRRRLLQPALPADRSAEHPGRHSGVRPTSAMVGVPARVGVDVHVGRPAFERQGQVERPDKVLGEVLALSDLGGSVLVQVLSKIADGWDDVWTTVRREVLDAAHEATVLYRPERRSGPSGSGMPCPEPHTELPLPGLSDGLCDA